MVDNNNEIDLNALRALANIFEQDIRAAVEIVSGNGDTVVVRDEDGNASNRETLDKRLRDAVQAFTDALPSNMEGMVTDANNFTAVSYYAAAAEQPAPPVGANLGVWQAAIPALAAGEDLYVAMGLKSERDGNTYYSTFTVFTISKGAQGEPGAPGAPGAPGQDGNNGWSIVPALIIDRSAVYLGFRDWDGGTGPKPPAPGIWLGANGWVNRIEDAVNIMGPQGPKGDPGDPASGGGAGLDNDQLETLKNAEDLATLLQLVEATVGTVVDAEGAAVQLNATAVTTGITWGNPLTNVPGDYYIAVRVPQTVVGDLRVQFTTGGGEVTHYNLIDNRVAKGNRYLLYGDNNGPIRKNFQPAELGGLEAVVQTISIVDQATLTKNIKVTQEFVDQLVELLNLPSGGGTTERAIGFDSEDEKSKVLAQSRALGDVEESQIRTPAAAADYQVADGEISVTAAFWQRHQNKLHIIAGTTEIAFSISRSEGDRFYAPLPDLPDGVLDADVRLEVDDVLRQLPIDKRVDNVESQVQAVAPLNTPAMQQLASHVSYKESAQAEFGLSDTATAAGATGLSAYSDSHEADLDITKTTAVGITWTRDALTDLLTADDTPIIVVDGRAVYARGKAVTEDRTVTTQHWIESNQHIARNGRFAEFEALSPDGSANGVIPFNGAGPSGDESIKFEFKFIDNTETGRETLYTDTLARNAGRGLSHTENVGAGFVTATIIWDGNGPRIEIEAADHGAQTRVVVQARASWTSTDVVSTTTQPSVAIDAVTDEAEQRIAIILKPDGNNLEVRGRLSQLLIENVGQTIASTIPYTYISIDGQLEAANLISTMESALAAHDPYLGLITQTNKHINTFKLEGQLSTNNVEVLVSMNPANRLEINTNNYFIPLTKIPQSRIIKIEINWHNGALASFGNYPFNAKPIAGSQQQAPGQIGPWVAHVDNTEAPAGDNEGDFIYIDNHNLLLSPRQRHSNSSVYMDVWLKTTGAEDEQGLYFQIGKDGADAPGHINIVVLSIVR